MTPEELEKIAHYWRVTRTVQNKIDQIYKDAGLSDDMMVDITLDDYLFMIIMKNLVKGGLEEIIQKYGLAVAEQVQKLEEIYTYHLNIERKQP